jgi:hypothetical protein
VVLPLPRDAEVARREERAAPEAQLGQGGGVGGRQQADPVGHGIEDARPRHTYDDGRPTREGWDGRRVVRER